MATLISILVVALLAAIATVIFALGNPGIVSVHFLNWSFDSSLTLLMLAPFAIGLLVGWLVSLPTSIRKSLTIAASKKTAKGYQSELKQQDELKTHAPETDPLSLP